MADLDLSKISRGDMEELYRRSLLFRLPNWQPIETAPKTDEPILVAFDNGETEIVTDSDETDWQPYDGINQSRLGSGEGISKPTHWMPLPAHPSA